MSAVQGPVVTNSGQDPAKRLPNAGKRRGIPWVWRSMTPDPTRVTSAPRRRDVPDVGRGRD